MLSQEFDFLGFRSALPAITLALLAIGLTGCDRRAPEPSGNVGQAPATPAPRKTPAPNPVLSRSDLLDAAGMAASAYAEGKQPEGADPLVGRTFAVRIAFGCSGPAAGESRDSAMAGLASWSPGPDGKTIELRMVPGEWAGSALIAGGTEDSGWEAVEGFWIPRPWLTSDSCPAVKGDPLQPGDGGAAPQTLGLAAVFDEGGSRIGRRNGRAYSFTVRGEGDASPPTPRQGYRLALEGRIAAFPGGRAIRCRASGPNQRPVCVVAAKLDRVGFENAEGDTLSEWRPG